MKKTLKHKEHNFDKKRKNLGLTAINQYVSLLSPSLIWAYAKDQASVFSPGQASIPPATTSFSLKHRIPVFCLDPAVIPSPATYTYTFHIYASENADNPEAYYFSASTQPSSPPPPLALTHFT
jgi:hypothetical protein